MRILPELRLCEPDSYLKLQKNSKRCNRPASGLRRREIHPSLITETCFVSVWVCPRLVVVMLRDLGCVIGHERQTSAGCITKAGDRAMVMSLSTDSSFYSSNCYCKTANSQ